MSQNVKIKGSFKVLVRNLRIKKNEKYKIPEVEDAFLQREESTNNRLE